MKQGLKLSALAAELERQIDSKRDFVIDTRKVELTNDAKAVKLPGVGEFPVTPFAHKQLAGRLDMPVAFYDRMREKHPDLLSNMVNGLFVREPQKQMVRTLDGNARAFQSSSFRPLDNYDFAMAVLPPLQEAGAIIESCQLTETKLYIKALCPWLDRELPIPEGLKMGVGHNFFVRKIIGAICLSNSEVGAGSMLISPATFENQCTNLAVYKSDGYGKIHVGKRKDAGEMGVREYLSDDTRKLEDATEFAKARDIVKATMDGRIIDAIVKRLNAARADAIEGDPAAVVEVFAKKNDLRDNERGSLLKLLVDSGEMTRYGLQWAVTRLAGEVDNYDRASELERLGGEVIELPRSEWQTLAKAA